MDYLLYNKEYYKDILLKVTSFNKGVFLSARLLIYELINFARWVAIIRRHGMKPLSAHLPL